MVVSRQFFNKTQLRFSKILKEIRLIYHSLKLLGTSDRTFVAESCVYILFILSSSNIIIYAANKVMIFHLYKRKNMIDEFRGVKTRVIVEKSILRALIEAKLLYMECIQYKN